MRRLKMYMATLVTPAVPYILMIYYPEKIDPIFKYFYLSSSVFPWIFLLNIIFIFIYFPVVRDLTENRTNFNQLLYVKLYLTIFSIITTTLLLVLGLNVIKLVLYLSVGGIFLLGVWRHYIKKYKE